MVKVYWKRGGYNLHYIPMCSAKFCFAFSCAWMCYPLQVECYTFAHLSTVTSGPLHLSIHCYLSTDTDISHVQRPDYWRGAIIGENLLPTFLHNSLLKRLKWQCVRLHCPFEPGCPQHSPGGCQMLPDDTSPLSKGFISCTVASQWGWVCCPLFVVTTGDISQEHHAATKPLFSATLGCCLSMPPRQPSPPDFTLSLSPLTQRPSAERIHLSDSAIVSEPAHWLLLSLSVMRFD